MTTQTHQHLARDTRRLAIASPVAMAFVVVALVALAVALADMWPPRSLADPMGVSGVQ